MATLQSHTQNDVNLYKAERWNFITDVPIKPDGFIRRSRDIRPKTPLPDHLSVSNPTPLTGQRTHTSLYHQPQAAFSRAQCETEPGFRRFCCQNEFRICHGLGRRVSKPDMILRLDGVTVTFV